MIQVNRIYLIFNRLVTKKFLVDTSGIRFKVNKKDWLSGIDSLFLCLNVIFPLFSYSFILSL